MRDLGNGFAVQWDDDGEYLVFLREDDVKDLETAWDLAITKWENCAELGIPDGGGATCGLCLYQEYLGNLDCKNCLITIAGHEGCRRTPYGDYGRAIVIHGPGSPKAKAAAREELEFLRSVRQKFTQEGDHDE